MEHRDGGVLNASVRHRASDDTVDGASTEERRRRHGPPRNCRTNAHRQTLIGRWRCRPGPTVREPTDQGTSRRKRRARGSQAVEDLDLGASRPATGGCAAPGSRRGGLPAGSPPPPSQSARTRAGIRDRHRRRVQARGIDPQRGILVSSHGSLVRRCGARRAAMKRSHLRCARRGRSRCRPPASDGAPGSTRVSELRMSYSARAPPNESSPLLPGSLKNRVGVTRTPPAPPENR